MKRPSCIVILTYILATVSAYAHDAWLAARWNKDKTQIMISVLVAEQFPYGNAIKGLSRFSDPLAYIEGRTPIALKGDPSDSSVLGALAPIPSFVVATGVKQREIKFKPDLAKHYFMEEIGLSKEETAAYLTAGVQEFEETYSRYLKAIITTEPGAPKDTALNLPLEILLTSWTEGAGGRATVTFQLLSNGMVVGNAPVRILSDSITTIVRTNAKGEAQATVTIGRPALLAYIQLTKLADNRFNSIWTNLAIYKLYNQKATK